MNILKEIISEVLGSTKNSMDEEQCFDDLIEKWISPYRFRPKQKSEKSDKLGTFVGAEKVPYTPIPLIRKMIGKNINLDKNARIAVLYTIEAAFYLKYKGFSDITLTSLEYDEKLEKFAEYYGFKYNTIEQLEKDQMKFNFIIGNPPYQKHKKGKRGTSVQLWPEFINKCKELITHDGVISLITPAIWLKNPKKYFNQFNLTFVNLDVGKYFQDIHTTTSWFNIKKEHQNNQVNVINTEGKEIEVGYTSLKVLVNEVSTKNLLTQTHKNILKKYFSKPGISFCVGSGLSINTDYSENKSSIFQYPTIYSTAAKRRHLFAKKPTNGINELKLCMARICDLSSKNAEWFLPITELGAGWQMFYLVGEKTYLTNLQQILINSKVFNFIDKNTRYGRYTKIYKHIPKLDFSKYWTDQELYEYFNLTQEEINLIEKSVK